MVRRALARQTRWYENRCSTFKIEYFIVQKAFWKILEFWPLVTSILTWAKKDRYDFKIIFRVLSNAVFRFVLRCAGAEIDGGVFKHPPSGGGKSRGPSGRRLSLYINRFVSRRATRSFFSRSSSSITGETAQGVVQTPLVPWKDAQWPVPARVKGTAKFNKI